MNVLDLRKYFTKQSGLNFLNDFTLQDVEDAKKTIFTKNFQIYGDTKAWLDKAAEKMVKDKFFNVKEEQQYVVKNTIRDTMNGNYRNTISRLILIDSTFRQQLRDPETDFLIHLNDKVNNATSLELTNIQIPYTFYNIDEALHNNYFLLTCRCNTVNGAVLQGSTNAISTTTTIKIPNGHYPNTDAILVQINLQLDNLINRFTTTIPNHLRCVKDVLSGTVRFENYSAAPYDIEFLTNESKVNSCLGWELGFREFQTSASTNQTLTMKYEIPRNKGPDNPTIPGIIRGTEVAMAPHPKYFVLVVDDFNQTQTADTMVQANIRPENTKATSHFTQDPLLDYLMPYNLSTYLDTMKDQRTLTKNQLYTIAQQNMERQNLSLQNTRLEVYAPNQVLGLIPFEHARADWGSMYFTDKSKYIREYHSPTNLERLQVKLYDDKGHLLNLRGNSWCMTLTTQNLYKY